VGLDTVIDQRIGKKTVGFRADVKGKKERDVLATLEQIQPADLVKFGLIPEFVGRLPVVAALGELDKKALVQILTEPRNALVKQFQRIFEYEDVRLTFDDESLQAIAQLALDRKIGARGLRLIMEELMLDLMFQVPSTSGVKECLITKEVVLNKVNPLTLLEKAG